MSIHYFNEDLGPILKNKQFQVFAHGCNCFCTMGAGIAKKVKQIFPNVYNADCSSKKGDKNKLGSIKIVDIHNNQYVINAYTQYDFRNGRNADYQAIRSCMSKINRFMNNNNLDHLTLPKIGAGLAGGNWNTIEDIILDEINDDIQIDVYYL